VRERRASSFAQVTCGCSGMYAVVQNRSLRYQRAATRANFESIRRFGAEQGGLNRNDLDQTEPN